MREIKFRAWDRRLKFMSIVSIIEWDKLNPENPIYIRGRIINKIEPDLLKRGVYQEWQTGGETETLEAIKMEDVVLMQFTGLHDKNGKEAWESDLAEYWEGDELVTMEIALEKGQFVLGGTPLCDIGDFEIKGNIYEN